MTPGADSITMSGARLSVDSEGEVDGPSWPNGTHICEVEIDPETGITQVVKYTTVDDVGVAVNPMLVTGQVHGGVAQGIGQALYEGVSYNEEGQLLTFAAIRSLRPAGERWTLAEVAAAAKIEPEDPLKFKDTKRYRDRLVQSQKQTGERDALIVMAGKLAELDGGGWFAGRPSPDERLVSLTRYLSANESQIWMLDLDSGVAKQVAPSVGSRCQSAKRRR